MTNERSNSLREFGKCRLDLEKRLLWCDDKPAQLPLKSVELLCLLVGRGGEIVTKDEIWSVVWQDSFVEETNLTHNVYLLRKFFRDLGERDLIQTVPRRGYRFAGEAREVAPEGELVIEKHTRTRTLIEISEEKEQGRKGEREKGKFLSRLFSPSVALILVLVVGVAFLGYRNWGANASEPEIRSIAVLPFKTIDAADENARSGLGLTDILITRLSSIRGIKVRPTAAVLNLGTEDSLAAGQKLKADAVLEGSIYRAGDRVRVTARLVKVADGATVWNGQFERLKTDELRLQNEIAWQVTEALRLNLSGDEKQALAKNYTENADAFELYQKGRFEWNKRNWQAMLEAEQRFRGAIAKDPKFALAYVGLADTLAMRNDPTGAWEAIEKAVELDPNLAEAHASRGFFQMFNQWDWQKAEASFRKSIELNPNYTAAHHWHAQVLTVQGRHREAEAAMLRALEINPLSHNFLADLGQIYYFNREYDKAEEYCRRALEIYPDFIFAHEYLHDVYLKTGEYEKAVEAEIKAYEINLIFANQAEERKKIIRDDFDQKRKNFREGGIKKFVENSITDLREPVFNYLNATKYAFLGEKEKALELLEKAVADRAFLVAFVKADPVFDDLRNEPRFREMLRKMNLP